MKHYLMGIMLCILATFVNAQPPCIPSNPFPNNACGDLNTDFKIISSNPICFTGCVTLQLKTDILADAIKLKFGDGHDTIITPTNLITTFTYCYNMIPSDSVIPNPPLQLLIESEFYKCCSGGYSYAYNAVRVSIMFLPRVNILAAYDTVCINTNPQISLQHNHNGFLGYPATTEFIFGDTTSPLISPNLTTFGYPAWPAHTYSTAGIYWLMTNVTNACGTVRDSQQIVVASIDNIIYNNGPHCSGQPINFQVQASNGGSYNVSVTPSSGVTIAGQQSSNPQITFNTPGTYTLNFTIGNPTICPVTRTITILPGPSMNLFSSLDTICLTGSFSYNFNSHFASLNSSQQNIFNLIHLVSGSPVVLFNSTTIGSIPTNNLNITNPGTYVAIDSSTTGCNGYLVRADTFYLIPTIVLPAAIDSIVCEGSWFQLPGIYPQGLTILLNGINYNGSGFNASYAASPYHFIVTPSCGNPTTFDVHVHPPTNLQVSGILADCYQTSYSFSLASHYSSTNTSQTNSFTIQSVTSGYIWSFPVQTGIPSASVVLADTGAYIITDSITDICNTLTVRRDTFHLLQFSMPVYSPDTICPGIWHLPPLTNGINRYLNGFVYPSPDYTFSINNMEYTFYYISICGDSTEYKIHVKSRPASVISGSTHCISDGVITLNATIPGGNFFGNYVSGNQFDCSAAGAGSHQFAYSYSSDGCLYTDYDTIIVSSLYNPLYSAPQYLCVGDSALIVIQGGPQSIVLDSIIYFDDTLSLVLPNIGTYYYQIGNSSACTIIKNDSIVVNQTPFNAQLDIGPSQVCFSSTINPIVLASNGFPYIVTYPDGNTYSAFPLPGFNCTVPSNEDSAVYLFNATITVAGCSDLHRSSQVTVYNRTIAQVFVSNDTICPYDTLNISNVTLAQWLTDSVSWLVDGIQISTNWNLGAYNFIGDTANSIHRVTLIIRNKYCLTFDSTSIDVFVRATHFPFAVNSSTNEYCQGSPIQINYNNQPAGTITWGVDDYGVLFSDLQYPIRIDTSGIVTVNFFSQGCTLESDKLTFTIFPKPKTTIFHDENIPCTNSEVHFHAAQLNLAIINSIQWNFGDLTTDSQHFNPVHVYSDSGNYFVTLITVSDHNCYDTSETVLSLIPTPIISLTVLPTYCEGSSIKLSSLITTTVSSTDSIVWTIFEGADTITRFNNESIILSVTGNITMQCYVNHQGCENTVSAFTKVFPKPDALFDIDDQYYVVPFSKIMTINKTNSNSVNFYHWILDDGFTSFDRDIVHQYDSGGTRVIKLLVRNQYMCYDSLSKQIQTENSIFFYIPNVFTPNGDGINETFKPICPIWSEKERYQFSIYDRWGMEIFKTNDYSISWDGKFNGLDCQADVYVYIVQYTHSNDKEQVKTGQVSLIR